MNNTKVNEISNRIFCGNVVNVQDYYNTFDQNSDIVTNRQNDAMFIKFSWLDISSYTLDDDRLSNLAVRADQNMGSPAEDIAHGFKSKGWEICHFPPIVGTDSVPRDGRTRIRAALMCGEKFIPCAIYSYSENLPVRNSLSNALRANDHSPARRASWKDFIAAGVRIIQSGEMTCDLKDIEHWLYNEVNIASFYSNVGGNITKLTKQIYEKAKRNKNGHLIILRERGEWIEWLKTSIYKHSLYYLQEFGIQSFDDIAFYDSGGNRAEQVFCRYVLPNASKGIVTNIVLYSVDDDPDTASYNHETFIKSMHEFHDQMYGWVNKELSGIKLIHPATSHMWRIVGVIPQFLNNKQTRLYKNHFLAKTEDVPKSSKGLNSFFDYAEEEAA